MKKQKTTKKQEYVLVDTECDLIHYFSGTPDDIVKTLIKHFNDFYEATKEDADNFNKWVRVYPVSAGINFKLISQQTVVKLKA